MVEGVKPITLKSEMDRYLEELADDPMVGSFMPHSELREDIAEVSAIPLAKFRRKQAVQTIRSAAALELLRVMPKIRVMLDSDTVSWSVKLKAISLLLQYGVGEQRNDKLADALSKRGGVLLLPPESLPTLQEGKESLALPLPPPL